MRLVARAVGAERAGDRGFEVDGGASAVEGEGEVVEGVAGWGGGVD